MYHLAHPCISLDGFSAMGNGSSALSLKTLPRSFFTRLRRARSPSIPPISYHQMKKGTDGAFFHLSRMSKKDGFMEKCCGVVNPCVCPYDFVKFCSEKIIRGCFLPSEAGL